ncbi:uncharacterized protein LOC121663375 [Corvus kubaryi]|uniref:uncharacterized protein LOC121663375 n=1 Tax=Corvus kubaryi TaxID=68294 RepID=UPI001C03F94C|nr:uncharacterized protein LOC121663375 [Corvus kubaryi]
MGAWRWLRQRSREGLASPGWWEPPGRLPRAGLAPAGKSRHPLSLKNCLGETGPLRRAEPRGCSRPRAGEVGVRGGSGARIAAALPQPSPAPFAASQQLLKAEKKKKKRLEKHFEKQGREKRPSSRQPHPLLLLPAPASFVCRRCRASGELSLSPSVGDHCPDTPGCQNKALPPRPPPKSLQPQAQRWLLPETSPVTPTHSRGVRPLPHTVHPGLSSYPVNPGRMLCPLPAVTSAPRGAQVGTGTSWAQVGACCGRFSVQPPTFPSWSPLRASSAGNGLPQPAETTTPMGCSHPGLSQDSWLSSLEHGGV